MSIFDISLELLIIFGYLNKSYSSSGNTGILKSDIKHRTQKAAEKANELYCYSCKTLDVNQNTCVNVTRTNTSLHNKCEEERRICMVKKVSFMATGENATIGHKTWSLERSCTDRCDPGCIVIGERLKLRKCVTCCTEDYCNWGNNCQRTPSIISPFPLIMNIFVIIRIRS